jgi:uncharacterized protein YdeI (BOF family)
MILVKSLIVLLLLLIIAHLIRVVRRRDQNDQNNVEGFQSQELEPIAPGENIADELESQIPPLEKNTPTASQKAQADAHVQQTGEEEKSIKKHQYISKDFTGQVEELIKLSREAQSIQENFESLI